MPECQKKVSLASAFLPVVSCFSQASAFRQTSPALSSNSFFHSQNSSKQNETKLLYVYFNDLKVQKKFEMERNKANIVAKQNSGIFSFPRNHIP
jgi:hypothetical protein